MKSFSCLILAFVTWSMTWNMTWGMEPDQAGDTGHHLHPQSPIQESLYRANKNAEEAWEAFHQAALGGTLASPAIQAQIEQALHECRLLLVDARRAAEQGDHRTVAALTVRIEAISTQVKERSRRRKP